MTTREEEMAKLKARYAQSRGKIIEETPILQKETRRDPTIEKPKEGKIKRLIKPYLYLIESDIRWLLRMKPKAKKEKPLNLQWLEERRRFF